MTKLSKGNTFPDITYTTPFAEDVHLSETVKKVSGKTAVIFLRYYGCTLCQYDMHIFSKEYEKIKGVNGQLIIVLQSDPSKIKAQITEDTFPFTIICDPEQKLYQEFEIWPAESKEKMADLKVLPKIAKATAAGMKHGDYEGNELQLPAAFIMDDTLMITYAHYAKTLSDMPSVDELAELLKK